MLVNVLKLHKVVSKQVPARIVNAINRLPCWRCTKDSNMVRLCVSTFIISRCFASESAV